MNNQVIELLANLQPRQLAALEAVVAGDSTIVEAVKSAGVSPRSWYQWLQEPTFAQAYQALKRVRAQRILARMEGSNERD
ncbi:MAG: hypothetical protein HS126_00060 [Anaerolineales bacterium]|nr:hypothetical protein [Anaerolineales bacterium]